MLSFFQDKRLRLTINGNRKIVGTLRGFDAFLNVVLEEALNESDNGFIGQIVIRGNSIVQFETLERVWQCSWVTSIAGFSGFYYCVMRLSELLCIVRSSWSFWGRLSNIRCIECYVRVMNWIYSGINKRNFQPSSSKTLIAFTGDGIVILLYLLNWRRGIKRNSITCLHVIAWSFY